MNQKSYVIGGYVRDFLIGKNVCKKVSIVTVGDCIKLAKKVCEKLDHKHKINRFIDFGTAIIKYNNFKIIMIIMIIISR